MRRGWGRGARATKEVEGEDGQEDGREEGEDGEDQGKLMTWDRGEIWDGGYQRGTGLGEMSRTDEVRKTPRGGGRRKT